MTLTAHEQDIKTQAQVEAINQEIKATQPLTSSLKPIESLSSHLNLEQIDDSSSNSNSNFTKGCKYLSSNYTSFRAIRGDGNCYYRAFLYALCEKLMTIVANKRTGSDADDGNEQQKKEVERIQTYVKNVMAEVTKFGYDQFTIDMFHEELVELIDFVTTTASTSTSTSNNNGELSRTNQLHEKLNEENGTSDYCTWFLRVITSAYIKKDADRFIHFLDDPNYFDVMTFCQREVDPMGRECGQVQVLALAEAFQIVVHIEYLDGNNLTKDGKLVKHTFGASLDNNNGEDGGMGDLVHIHLLYRPGHYDILYK